MENMMVEKLTADPFKLASYPVSDDDAPVRSERSLTKRIESSDVLFRAFKAILTVAIIATVMQLLVVGGRALVHATFPSIDPFEPVIAWVYLISAMIMAAGGMLIARRAHRSLFAERYFVYRAVPQGRIVKMDKFGERPHVLVEGHNSRNEIRTEWRRITVGEWENWVSKYMERGIYVDFRVQDDAGE